MPIGNSRFVALRTRNGIVWAFADFYYPIHDVGKLAIM